MTEQLAETDLRDVEAADVYKDASFAGQLVRERDDVVFRYDEAYRSAPLARPVARTLPLQLSEVRATAGSVPAFFAGLLPEGVRLQATISGTRTSADDHLTLLLAVGGDTVGDVRVVPAGVPPVQPPVVFDEAAPPAGFDLLELFEDLASPRGVSLDPRALPGVQPKVSAAMLSTPVRTTGGPAILKLEPPRGYPRLIENEAFFLDLADACGLPVPAHRIVHDDAGRAGLLVSRFDRVEPERDAGMVRLEQEDACQVLGVYPAAKYRIKTEQAVVALADAVRDGDGSRPLALRRLLELVAFSYLIGNGDLHGKNMSVLRGLDGRTAVTPVYDVLCTQPYLSWKDPMALDLYGRANRIRRSDLLDAGGRLGLPGRALVRALDRICDEVEPRIDDVQRIGFDERTTERVAEMLRTRLAELKDARGAASSR